MGFGIQSFWPGGFGMYTAQSARNVSKTLNPKPLNPKPLNPKLLNPKPLNPKPINPTPYAPKLALNSGLGFRIRVWGFRVLRF